MNKRDLILFEEEIATLFNSGKIRAPVHLYKGNEEKIINVFRNIKKNDWVFCSWRSHYQCLLKGVPAKEVKEEILNNKTKNIIKLERAYNNASNPAFKTMWLKKLYQLQGNNEKKQ